MSCHLLLFWYSRVGWASTTEHCPVGSTSKARLPHKICVGPNENIPFRISTTIELFLLLV